MILDKGWTYVYYMGSTLGWPNELGRSVRQASQSRFRTKPTARGNPTLSPRVHHQDRGSHISWHQCVGSAHESTPLTELFNLWPGIRRHNLAPHWVLQSGLGLISSELITLPLDWEFASNPYSMFINMVNSMMGDFFVFDVANLTFS